MPSTWAHKLPTGMTDLKLGLGLDSLPITHFHNFVYPEQSTPATESFHRFTDLPLEIRLLIFQHCDTPTLFHLLHTCSYTRRECLKLFWEPEDNLWYRSEQGSNIFMKPFYPAYDCPEFASRITQVEIPMYWAQMEIMLHNGNAFWDKLREFYPLVRKVVLSGHSLRSCMPPSPGEYDYEYSLISTLVERAPPNITALVALQSGPRENAMQFRLWRLEAGPCWHLVKEVWTPMRVYLPWRKVPAGILRDLLSMQRVRSAAFREKRAMDWLTFQTYGYYSSNAFGMECPDVGCNSKFPALDEWVKHVQGSHGGLWDSDGKCTIKCHPNTPAETKAVLSKKQVRVDQRNALSTSWKAGIQAQWDGDETDEKDLFNDILVSQMKEHGFLQPNDSSVWDSELWENNHTLFVPDCAYNL